MTTLTIDSTHESRTLYLTVADAEPIGQPFSRVAAKFRPTWMRLTYFQDNDGDWQFDGGRVSGPYVRKDGTDGDTRDFNLQRYSAIDPKLPTWITDAIRDNTPQAGR